jgi:hypothetical protein
VKIYLTAPGPLDPVPLGPIPPAKKQGPILEATKPLQATKFLPTPKVEASEHKCSIPHPQVEAEVPAEILHGSPDTPSRTKPLATPKLEASDYKASIPQPQVEVQGDTMITKPPSKDNVKHPEVISCPEAAAVAQGSPVYPGAPSNQPMAAVAPTRPQPHSLAPGHIFQKAFSEWMFMVFTWFVISQCLSRHCSVL